MLESWALTTLETSVVDPTPHWGIHRWDDTAPAAPLEDFFNTQADDLEAALDGAATGWFLRYATKAAMDAVPGTDIGQHATVYADSTATKNGDYVWNGAAWKIYSSFGRIPFTPTIAHFTTGTSTVSGWYVVNNGVCEGQVHISLASGWFISGGTATISAPVTPDNPYDGNDVGRSTFLRSATGYFVGGSITDASGGIKIMYQNGGFWSPVSPTAPASFDNGDTFSINFRYAV